MKCLKCEKELRYLMPGSTNVDDGGDMVVTFHYGSRHDLMLGFSNERFVRPTGNTRLEWLLRSDRIMAYICDDCFAKHAELFEGL